MPIMRSAILCGSYSGDLVPDPHYSVPESGDIEILDTHVSPHDLGGWSFIKVPQPLKILLMLGRMFKI